MKLCITNTTRNDYNFTGTGSRSKTPVIRSPVCGQFYWSTDTFRLIDVHVSPRTDLGCFYSPVCVQFYWSTVTFRPTDVHVSPRTDLGCFRAALLLLSISVVSAVDLLAPVGYSHWLSRYQQISVPSSLHRDFLRAIFLISISGSRGVFGL